MQDPIEGGGGVCFQTSVEGEQRWEQRQNERERDLACKPSALTSLSLRKTHQVKKQRDKQNTQDLLPLLRSNGFHDAQLGLRECRKKVV